MSIYDAPKPVDAVTLKRQQDCPHTPERFIRGMADDTPRCPWCGESRASWEARGKP
jgi:hypothetical protein